MWTAGRGLAKRFIHLSSAARMGEPKTALAKLRKKTGYSLSLCKKALENNEQDVSKAQEWLKASHHYICHDQG